MSNSPSLFILLSLFSPNLDEVTALQIEALCSQLNIKVTVYAGRLVVVMSQVSKALGLHPKDFAKNLVFTGRVGDLAGAYKLLRGNDLKTFRTLYQQQHSSPLGPHNAIYVGDLEMCHSYISSKVAQDKVEKDLGTLYSRMEELYGEAA